MFRRWTLFSVPIIALAVGGLAYGFTKQGKPNAPQGEAAAFVCPATGEELPCSNCCPLRK